MKSTGCHGMLGKLQFLFLLLPFLAAPGSASDSSGSEKILEEVLVTARKRAEPLLKTPISITAFTQAELEQRQLTNISEIGDYTPNLEFDFTTPLSGSSNSASVFIRGVGQTDYVPNKDPGVGIYVDGVYLARSIGSVLNLLDVERIEVLRGPQGTLFGKNTVGGAIDVTMATPVKPKKPAPPQVITKIIRKPTVKPTKPDPLDEDDDDIYDDEDDLYIEDENPLHKDVEDLDSLPDTSHDDEEEEDDDEEF